MKKNVLIVSFISFFIPNIIFAACTLDPDPTISGILAYIGCIINQGVIPLIFTAAFALFVYGVLQYMLNPTEETKRTKGKQFMIWGIIALTVMFSVWGLVKMLGGSFNLLEKDVAIPTVDL